ncbi:MAG: arylesterase [Candidatus Lindowbacteria bacterium]|nr:arylesterase [Candidatus Lindowbacteria bacterium]
MIRNQKLILIFVFLLLTTSGCGDDPSNQTYSPPRNTIKIIMFGDSLTAGTGLRDPQNKSFTSLLQNSLSEKGYKIEFVNQGVSGNTTEDALARLNKDIPRSADIVIVEFGANDVFKKWKIERIEKNLNQIIKKIKSRGPNVVVLEMKTFPHLGLFYSRDFYKLYGRAADRYDVQLVPFFLEEIVGDPNYNFPDLIHPNSSGHAKIADFLEPHIQKAISEL